MQSLLCLITSSSVCLRRGHVEHVLHPWVSSGCADQSNICLLSPLCQTSMLVLLLFHSITFWSRCWCSWHRNARWVHSSSFVSRLLCCSILCMSFFKAFIFWDILAICYLVNFLIRVVIQVCCLKVIQCHCVVWLCGNMDMGSHLRSIPISMISSISVQSESSARGIVHCSSPMKGRLGVPICVSTILWSDGMIVSVIFQSDRVWVRCHCTYILSRHDVEYTLLIKVKVLVLGWLCCHASQVLCDSQNFCRALTVV